MRVNAAKKRRSYIDLYCCRSCHCRNSVDFDEVTGDRVCTACGIVATRWVQHDTDLVYTFPEVYFRGAAKYSRPTHIRERTRLWNGSEPAIPRVEIERLKDTYAFLRAAEPHIWVNKTLEKPDIAFIIDVAGLSKRQLLEKWITIRALLTGEKRRAVCPIVQERVENDMNALSVVWEKHKHKLVKLVKRKRRNIPNLNYLFHQVLLRLGQDYYDYYKADFPQVGAAKAAELAVFYFAMCQILGWQMRASYRMLPLE